MKDPQPEEVLALVKESPAHVAAHDKESWLALFSRSASIEDPVGSAPHARGGSANGDPIERFYETFIAPNEIRIESALDAVAGREVARDVVIHTRLSSGVSIDVAAYLLYEVAKEDGQLRLQRMSAHWNLPAMSWQVVSGGLAGLAAMTAVTFRMARFQGLAGIWGYMAGMRSIGSRGRGAVEKFAAAVRTRDERALASLLVERGAVVEWPVPVALRERSAAADLLAQLPPGTVLRCERPITGGPVTAFRFEVFGPAFADKIQPGIGFFYFDAATSRIARARFFFAGSQGGSP